MIGTEIETRNRKIISRMKKFAMFTFSLITTAFAFAQNPAPASKADIQFVEDSHDFGNIKEGTQATYEFKFKNTGTEALTLSDVRPSCGCTTPEWTRDSILPGATGVIKAIFNSSGRPGSFNKSITVTSNAASGQKVITFRGFVEAATQPLDQAAPAAPLVDQPAPASVTPPAPATKSAPPAKNNMKFVKPTPSKSSPAKPKTKQ